MIGVGDHQRNAHQQSDDKGKGAYRGQHAARMGGAALFGRDSGPGGIAVVLFTVFAGKRAIAQDFVFQVLSGVKPSKHFGSHFGQLFQLLHADSPLSSPNMASSFFLPRDRRLDIVPSGRFRMPEISLMP